MTTLQCSPLLAGPGSFIMDSAAPELDAQSEVGRQVREADRKARCLSRGRALLLPSEEPTATAVARQTLRAALERYRRPDGYEGYLVESAWQLEQMGREAWPVLRELLLAGAPECEYFLGAVVRLEGV